jgi:hypothetical protein
VRAQRLATGLTAADVFFEAPAATLVRGLAQLVRDCTSSGSSSGAVSNARARVCVCVGVERQHVNSQRNQRKGSFILFFRKRLLSRRDDRCAHVGSGGGDPECGRAHGVLPCGSAVPGSGARRGAAEFAAVCAAGGLPGARRPRVLRRRRASAVLDRPSRGVFKTHTQSFPQIALGVGVGCGNLSPNPARALTVALVWAHLWVHARGSLS